MSVIADDILLKPRRNWRNWFGLIPIGLLIMLMMIRPFGHPSSGALAWNASSGATGYKVYWNDTDAAGPPYTNSVDVGNVTEASPAGFDPGDPARVTAYDESGLEGYFSDEINTPSCDSTISSGIAAAVAAAANGAVICVNNGSYGSVSLSSITKTSYVTVRAVNPLVPSMSVTITNSAYIRIEGFELTGFAISGTSHHIALFENEVTGLSDIASSGGNNLVYGNTLNDLDYDGFFEGRLQLINTAVGAIIQHNEFARGGSDGIQDNSENAQIGPGNYFHDIEQSVCDGIPGVPHCDPIQVYGGTGTQVIGNFFKNNTTSLEWPDEGDGPYAINNNVFDGDPGDHPLDLGSQEDVTWKHNTSLNIDARVGGINQAGSGSGTYSESVMHAAAFSNFSGGGLAGSNCPTPPCTYTHNLYSNSGDAKGTNNVIGTPVYVGGANPSTWQGFKLDTGSPGKNAALDNGKDMGSNFFNPPAPANFREN